MDASSRRVVRRPVEPSDISDVEIGGYIHSEKEFRFRKIVWEMMYKGYDKKNPKERRKRKQNGKEKKKEAKISEAAARKIDKKERPLSSKINYDVLRKLMEEDGDQNQRDSGLDICGGGVRRQESIRRDGGDGGGGGEVESDGTAVGGDFYGYDAYGNDEEDGYRYGDGDDGGDYEGF